MSVREFSRRCVPLWARQVVQYHDGGRISNAGLIGLLRVKYGTRVSLLRNRPADKRDGLQAAEQRLAHLDVLKRRCTHPA
jgi:hypothetical protein